MGTSIFELMQQKQFHTEHGSIVYWISNGESEYTLVFLHGLTADHTLFEKQISYFKGRFHLFCWDAPAHGKSRPYADFSYFDAAKNLNDILEIEQLKNVIFIGQSMGGYITQTYMKQYPNVIKGFVGIDTCPFGLCYYSKSDMWWLRQIEWMSQCLPQELLIQSIAKSCSYIESAYQNILVALRPYSKQELCHLMGIGFAGFLKENCNLKITCPTILLVGQYDRTGKVKQYCEAWHKETQFPLHIIPRAAHVSNLDNSEAVNQEIDIFIKDILQ